MPGGNMSRTIKSTGLLMILSLSGLCLDCAPSLAQGYNRPVSAAVRRPPVRLPGQKAARTVQPAEFQGVSLDRDVALPSLPGYTGKQIFLTGMQYPNANGGPGYMVIYNTEHTETQVRDWWRNALGTDPWKIDFKDARSIKAHQKDGSKCVITAGARQVGPPERMKGMNGSYTVYYHPKTK